MQANNNNLKTKVRDLIIPAEEIRETIKDTLRWERFTTARNGISPQIVECYEKRKIKKY